MVLGAGMISAIGMAGGVMHIAMHAFGKITLFFCAAASQVAIHKKYISQMDGLGRQMPITFFAFLIGSLSIIGLPPLGGFISKWNLVIGAVEGGQLVLLVVLLVSSLLNAAYFLPIVYRAFFAEPLEPAVQGIKEAPVLCLLPICATALCSFLLFFFHDVFLRLAQLAVAP